MKRIFTLFIFFGLFFSIVSYAEDAANNKPTYTHLDKIIAIVNREVITQSELNKEIELAKKQFQHTDQPMPPEDVFRKEVLDHLIAKSLQMQVARSKGINVTKEEQDKAIESIAKSNNINVEQLKEGVAQSGMDFDQYKRQIAEQLLIQKLQQEEVAKNITITDEDVKKFKQENRDKINQYSAYHVIDILLPFSETADQGQINEIKNQASALSQQLQSGKEVDVALKQYPYAEKNDLGWRALGEFPSLFQSKIAAMRIHNVTTPIPAPNGFHILKVVDAKGQTVNPTENNIKNMVFQQKVSAAVKDWIQKLRNDNYVKIMN